MSTRFRLAAILFGAAVACTEGAGRSGTLRTLQMVEDLRLDANAEDFSTVSSVSVGPHGEIVVPLRQDMQIRLYDSTGRRISAIGRRGSGPGEFQSFVRLGWIADTVWVLDILQRRISYFAPHSGLLRVEALPASLTLSGGPIAIGRDSGRMMFATPLAILPGGSMLVSGRFQRAGEREIWPRTILVIVDSNGTQRHSIEPPNYEDDRWFMTVEVFGRSVPFAARPLATSTTDGSRYAHLITEITSSTGGTYTVTLLRGSGDTAFVRTYPFEGAPIPQHAVDSALAAQLPRPGQQTEGPSDLGARFQRLARERIPPVYAPVSAMILGLDDTVWLTLRDTEDGRPVVVLDGTGNPVATLLLPRNTTLREASSTHVWVTETDDDGLASVVRYRIVEPVSPSERR